MQIGRSEHTKLSGCPAFLGLLSAILLSVFGFAGSAYAAPGNLDLTFGSGGKVTTAIGVSDDEAYALAVQQDGKLVAAGYSDTGSQIVFALTRYNTDGSLDATFGTGGIVTTPIGTVRDKAFALIIQPDGKLVAAGYSFDSLLAQNIFALVRYNTDGSLDPTFGAGGKVTTIIGGDDAAFALAIQADGKLVAGGYSYDTTLGQYVFAVARYNSTGTLDGTFGAGGKVTTPVGSDDVIDSVIIQPDGKLVAAGYAYDDLLSQYVFALARYNTDGTLDAAFGIGGKVTMPVGSDDLINSLIIQPDGKLVAAGYAYDDTLAQYVFALARYNTNGTLDGTFGTGGKVTTPIRVFDDVAYSLIIQSDGKLVAAGYSYDDLLNQYLFALARYNTNGSLDTTFGADADGIVTTAIGTYDDEAFALAIQADGKFVAAGYSSNSTGTQYSFVLARYLGGLTITIPTGASLPACVADYNGTCAFAPNPLTIESGDSVVWSNIDGAVAHTATSDDHADDLALTQPVAPENSFSTAQIEGGASSATMGPFINTTGTAQTKMYHCSLHPNMRGTLIINSTTTLSPPDLVMSVVSFSVSAVDPGTMLPVDNTVENQGSLSARSFTIAYRLSTNSIYGDVDDVVIKTTRSVKSLAAGSPSPATTSLLIPKTAPAGAYYVCAKADSASKVIESDETNNSLCSAGTIQVNRPDLVMSVVSFSVSAVDPGTMLPVDNTVENQGSLSAGSFTIAYRLSTNSIYGDVDDVVIKTTRSVKSLAAGTPSPATTSLLIPKTAPAGAYHVCAKADSASKVIESDETNNSLCSAGTIQVNRPDLVMSVVSFSVSAVDPGTMLPVDNTVENQGSLSAGSFTIAYRLSTNSIYGDVDDVVIKTTRSVKSLAAGTPSPATTSLLIPKTAPAGAYHVCAKADSASKVIESDETNNSLCSAGTIQVNRPDLVMSVVSFSVSAVDPGTMLPVDNTVENQGSLSAGSFTIAYRLSTNSIYGDVDDVVIKTTRSVKSLAAGSPSPATTSLLIPKTAPAGAYHVCAKADSASKVIESDETNNSLCSAGTIITPSTGTTTTTTATTTTTTITVTSTTTTTEEITTTTMSTTTTTTITTTTTSTTTSTEEITTTTTGATTTTATTTTTSTTTSTIVVSAVFYVDMGDMAPPCGGSGPNDIGFVDCTSSTGGFQVTAMTTISVGDTVTWTMRSTPHTVTSQTALGTGGGGPTTCGTGDIFDSGVSNSFTGGVVFSHLFNTPGTCAYFCILHTATMQGQVTITPPT